MLSRVWDGLEKELDRLEEQMRELKQRTEEKSPSAAIIRRQALTNVKVGVKSARSSYTRSKQDLKSLQVMRRSRSAPEAELSEGDEQRIASIKKRLSELERQAKRMR